MKRRKIAAAIAMIGGALFLIGIKAYIDTPNPKVIGRYEF